MDVKKIIIKLIKRTQEDSIFSNIEWKRIINSDFFIKNPLLEEFSKKIIFGSFANDRWLLIDSFYTSYKNGYIFILTNSIIAENEKIFLYIQPNENSKIQKLNFDNGYQEELKRLRNIIESSISDFDSFIDDLLSDD